jgi:hypothetical protein
MDGIKHRKAALKRLFRTFQIANMQAANAIPTNHSIVATWIHDMFAHFKPEVIKEIRNAKSKILILFDGWGSKRERLSVVGIVTHFINEKYEAVSRLIGLPELPGHGKTGVGELLFIIFDVVIIH